MTLIVGAGSSVALVTPLTALIDALKQHPLGTVTIAVDVTFPYSSTAAGVNIALDVVLGSPFTAIARATGVTVAPVGSPIFAFTVS